jgi:DNA-directed RNA polymerase subunit RPC12/RpoP
MNEPKAFRCPSCNSDLDIPEDKDIIECPYCGIDIKVRDTVKHELDTKSILELANHSLNKGDHEHALDYFSFIITKEPDNKFALLGRVKALISKTLTEQKPAEELRRAADELIMRAGDKNVREFVTDFVSKLFNKHMQQYKTELEIATKIEPDFEALTYIIDLQLDINPDSKKAAELALDYVLKLKQINTMIAFSGIKEEKLQGLFDRYIEIMNKIDTGSELTYRMKWAGEEDKKRRTRSNMWIGFFIIGLILLMIAFIIWILTG